MAAAWAFLAAAASASACAAAASAVAFAAAAAASAVACAAAASTVACAEASAAAFSTAAAASAAATSAAAVSAAAACAAASAAASVVVGVSRLVVVDSIPWGVLVDAASAPKVMRTTAAPSARPPAARLPNWAQPTRPRAKAITPTTRANNPNMTAAPLKPELSAPIRAARAKPPQPNEAALVKPRPPDAVTCPDFNNGSGIVSAGTPGAKCSVHNSPSQYLCRPSGCGYQPAGLLRTSPLQ